METSSTIRYIGFRRNSKLETSATSSRPFASRRHKADGWSNSTLPGQPRMSGRAFKYLTQPRRTDFNVNSTRVAGFHEHGFCKEFLGFAGNDRQCATRTQARRTLAPHVSHRTGAKYADSDCRAGQAPAELHEWRVQARR